MTALRALPVITQRQLAFAALVVIMLILVPAAGLPVTSAEALVGALAVLAATTLAAAAVPWQAVPVHWRVLVPLGGMVAVGLLRAATGEATSPFTLLVILPALSLGADARSWWPLLLVALGTDLSVLMPYLVLDDPAPLNAAVVVRALVVPAIATVAAVAVSLLTRDIRSRTWVNDALQRRQNELLDTMRRDADELAESARALRGARDSFSSVIDAVTEQAVVATDQDGLVRVFNPGAEKLLGLHRADVVRSARITDLMHPDEVATRDAAGRTGFAALVARASDGRPDVRETTWVGAGGTPVQVRVALTRRTDSDGTGIGYLFVATDTSAERAAARLKDEFVSLISHELRTPLSSILGYLELVLDDPHAPLTEEQAHYLGVVERNAHRLLHLVGDLLLTAQVEAGRLAVEHQPVNLAAVVTAAAESATPGAARAGVQLVTTVPSEPLLVSGDAVRLGQACDNLLSNAVKFTPAGGQVHLSLAVEPARGDTPARAVVTVRDTGFGIAEEEVERLFTRFFRASNATRNAVAGVGLGLTITRAIVLAHHGELDVASVEGEGTTFRFRVPLAGG